MSAWTDQDEQCLAYCNQMNDTINALRSEYAHLQQNLDQLRRLYVARNAEIEKLRALLDEAMSYKARAEVEKKIQKHYPDYERPAPKPKKSSGPKPKERVGVASQPAGTGTYRRAPHAMSDDATDEFEYYSDSSVPLDFT